MTEDSDKIPVPDVKDPGLKAVLERLAQTAERRFKEQSEIVTLKKEIIQTQPEPEQQYFAFFPVEIMRTSIFFPYSDQDISQKNLLHEISIQHSWGELKIKGVKLAIYQEDTLLRLLTEKKNAVECKTENHSGFKMSYKLSQISKGINQKSGANKKKKERILETLKDFQMINFLIKRKLKDEKGEYTNKHEFFSVGNIVSSWHYNETTDLIDVYFNPQFWSLFGEGMLAGIDINQRQKLKGDCAKALLRFIQAHKNPSPFHLLTVMKALNYNTNQHESYLKKILNRGIKELIKIGELTKKSKITKSYMVFFDYPQKDSTKKIK